MVVVAAILLVEKVAPAGERSTLVIGLGTDRARRMDRDRPGLRAGVDDADVATPVPVPHLAPAQARAAAGRHRPDEMIRQSTSTPVLIRKPRGTAVEGRANLTPSEVAR
jgi:hypothetical protein